MAGGGVRSGGVVMERKGKGGTIAGHVSEVSAGGGKRYAPLYGTGGGTKGDAEGKDRDEGVRVGKKVGRGARGELAKRCWEEMKGRFRRGKVVEGWEEEGEEFYEQRGWILEAMEGWGAKSRGFSEQGKEIA